MDLILVRRIGERRGRWEYIGYKSSRVEKVEVDIIEVITIE